MSRPEDAQPASVPSTEPVAPIVNAAPAQEFDMDSQSPEERRANFAKGVLPKRLPKVEAKPSESLPEKSAAVPNQETPAGTAPDSDHGDEEEPTNETPEQKKRRHRSLREEASRNARERDQYARENKALREQLDAASRKPAPTPAKTEPASDSLVRPRLKDYLAKYADLNEATEKYEDDLDVYNDKRAEIKSAKDRETQTKEQKQQAIAKAQSEARSKYKDFDKVVFGNATQKSPPANKEMAAAINEREDGYDIAWYLSENHDEAARIEEKSRGNRARVDVEFDMISEKLANPPKPPAEKKITSAPPPPKAVSGNGGGTADPLKTAQEIGQRTGNWEPFNKLMNERKMAKRGIVSK